MAREPGRNKRAISMSSDDDDVRDPSVHAKNRSPSVVSSASFDPTQVTKKAGIGLGRQKHTNTFFSLEEDKALIEFAATHPDLGGRKRTGVSLGVAFCEKFPKIGQRHPPVSVMTRLKKIKEHINKYDVPLEWKYALTENPVYLVLKDRARKKNQNETPQKSNPPTTSRVSEDDEVARVKRGDGNVKRARLDISDSETDPEVPPIDNLHEERRNTDRNDPKRTVARSVDANSKRGDVLKKVHDDAKDKDKVTNARFNGNKHRLSNLSSPDVIASSTDLMSLQPRTMRRGVPPRDNGFEERSVIPASYETNPSTSQQKESQNTKKPKNTGVTIRNDRPNHDESLSGTWKAKNSSTYFQNPKDTDVHNHRNKTVHHLTQKQTMDGGYRKLANSSSKTQGTVIKSAKKSGYGLPDDSDADEQDVISFSSGSEAGDDNEINGAAGIRIDQAARHRSRSGSTDTSEDQRLGKSAKPPANALLKKRPRIVTRPVVDVAIDRASSEEIPEPKSVSPSKELIPEKHRFRKDLAAEKRTCAPSRPPSPMRLDVACQTVQSTIGQPDKDVLPANHRIVTVDRGCQTKTKKPSSKDQVCQVMPGGAPMQNESSQTEQSWFTMVEHGVQTAKVTKDQGCQIREPVIIRVNRASSPVAAAAFVNRASSPITVVSCVDRASSPIRFETDIKDSSLLSPPADKKNDSEPSPAASDVEVSELAKNSVALESPASVASDSGSKHGMPSALKVGIFGTKKAANSEQDGKTHYGRGRNGKFLPGLAERTKHMGNGLGQKNLDVALGKSKNLSKPLELKYSARSTSSSPEVPEIIPLRRPRQRQVHFTSASPEIIQQTPFESSPGYNSEEGSTPDAFYHPLPTPSDEEESPPRFTQRIQPTQYVAAAKLPKETAPSGAAETVAAELPSGETDYFTAQGTQSSLVSVDLAAASQESGSSAKTLRFGSESCTPPDEILGTDRLKLDAEMVGQLAEKHGITPKEMVYALFRSNGSIMDAMTWLAKGDCDFTPSASSTVPTFVLDRALLEDSVENVATGPVGRARRPSMLKERAMFLNHDREALQAELEEQGTTVVEMLKLLYASKPDFSVQE